MQADTLTLAGRYYDGTAAIFRGIAGLPGLHLQVKEETSVPKMFTGFFRGDYDASEMSLAELVFYLTRDRNDFIAIPVFPSRVFRHSFLFCNAAAAIDGPESLSGRKIAFQRWVQTAGVWMRGMLVDEYGVSPTQTEWYVSSLHHWREEDGAVAPRDGSSIRWLGKGDEPQETEDAYRAVLEGRVDVMGVTEGQIAHLEQDSRVRRLFPEYVQAEADYYRKTQIFPIMHVIAIRREVVDRHPELPVDLFQLFANSKRLARAHVHSTPTMTLAWKDSYLDREAAVFGGDAWPFGLAANQHTLEKFLEYCYQQGIAARAAAPRDLFAPDTWDLGER